MAVFRYDPWQVLNQMQDEINRMLENRTGTSDADRSASCTADWIPSVDIKETVDAFVLVADIPGVEPSDIEITMEKGVLTIQGERTGIGDDERDQYKRLERPRGCFFRRFSLPDSADPEKIGAQGQNGVLEITIPKRMERQPRRIHVTS